MIKNTIAITHGKTSITQRKPNGPLLLAKPRSMMPILGNVQPFPKFPDVEISPLA